MQICSIFTFTLLCIHMICFIFRNLVRNLSQVNLCPYAVNFSIYLLVFVVYYSLSKCIPKLRSLPILFLRCNTYMKYLCIIPICCFFHCSTKILLYITQQICLLMIILSNNLFKMDPNLSHATLNPLLPFRVFQYSDYVDNYASSFFSTNSIHIL